MSEQYSWALFKAMSHMLSIGFGRFPPQNVTEVWLTIISMIIGATFYALFIANVSTLLLSTDYSGRLYDEKVLIDVKYCTLTNHCSYTLNIGCNYGKMSLTWTK